MPATNIDLYVEQGTTFNTSVTLTDTYNNPMNLENVLINGTIKTSYATSNVAANFIINIVDPANGYMFITLPYQTTANLWSAYTYVYDVVALDQNSNVAIRVINGSMYINPSVSSTP
jgi:hypothetical protein